MHTGGNGQTGGYGKFEFSDTFLYMACFIISQAVLPPTNIFIYRPFGNLPSYVIFTFDQITRKIYYFDFRKDISKCFTEITLSFGPMLCLMDTDPEITKLFRPSCFIRIVSGSKYSVLVNSGRTLNDCSSISYCKLL